MSQREESDVRRDLLAFVERNWRALTLREACLLRTEMLESEIAPGPHIKETLTFA